MNLYFRLSKRVYCLMTILVTVFCRVSAQQWVLDEISREDDGDSGGTFGGILGTIIFFGVIWLLVTIFGDKKKPDPNSHSDFHNDELDVPYYDDDDDDYDPIMFDDDYADEPFGDSYDSYSNGPIGNSYTPSSSLAVGQGQKIKDTDFERRCIAIYGDYAENTYGLVLIKEDGEYRQITYPDKRYEVLSAYIFKNHKERHTTVCTIGDSDLLKSYIEYHVEYNMFPTAKPMDSHGKLEKEYYGERIAMMKVYYYWKGYPYCSNGHSLRDFCLALGWDLCIYIHKYIGQPMDMSEYHDLKEMTLRKMTVKEYLEYRSKADYISERSEGWYDGWGNYIGRDYAEASAELDRRRVCTYQQAIEEVKQIDWSLKSGETLQEMKLATDKLLTAKSDS